MVLRVMLKLPYLHFQGAGLVLGHEHDSADVLGGSGGQVGHGIERREGEDFAAPHTSARAAYNPGRE
jgi:hypothetical protein